jgi:hypothetical protein
MLMREAESRLRSLLLEPGQTLDRLDPRTTWEVFRGFALEPIDDEGSDPEMCPLRMGRLRLERRQG